jgi:hypothetical protein
VLKHVKNTVEGEAAQASQASAFERCLSQDQQHNWMEAFN